MYRVLRRFVVGSAAVLSSCVFLAASQRAQHFNYDEDLAKLSTVYSSAAYDRNPAVGNWSFVNPACNEQTKGFILNETYTGEGTEAFAYVGLNDAAKMIVVAFKGTSDLRDWMTDLRSWVRYTKRCAPADTKSVRTTEELFRSGKGTYSDFGFDLDPVAETDSVRARVDSVAQANSEAGADADSEARLDASAHVAKVDANVDEGLREGEGVHVGIHVGVGGRERKAARVLEQELEGGGGGGGGGVEETEGRTGRGAQEAQRQDSEPGHGQDKLIGNVHFGFCEYYQSVVAKGLADRAALLARENPGYTVLVTGHSLGAAAAAVCAADLTQRMLVESERVVLYTLGEPRTGDGIFAEGLNDRVGTAYRVVHNRDVVPHLALCCHGWFGKCKAGEVSCPYQHATEIVYANDMGPGASWLMCNGTIGEDYACDPQAVDLSVSDHKHYFELLVGEYCATAPENLVPFPQSAAREEARWALYEAAMRRESGPRRFGRWPGDDNPSSSILIPVARS